jgi:hypothetical protein
MSSLCGMSLPSLCCKFPRRRRGWVFGAHTHLKLGQVSRSWAYQNRGGATSPHRKSSAEKRVGAELRIIDRTLERIPRQSISSECGKKRALLRSRAENVGQQWRRHWFRHHDNPPKPPRFRCPKISRTHSPSGEAFLSPALSISAPIFLDTLGACPLVCGMGARRVSVAASGTVATGGLFGAVLSTPVGALIVSCEGSFCADAMPTVTNSVATTNTDWVFIFRFLSGFLRTTSTSSSGSLGGSARRLLRILTHGCVGRGRPMTKLRRGTARTVPRYHTDHRYMEFTHEEIRSDVRGRGIVGFH